LAGYRRYLGAGSLAGKHDEYASTHLSVQANKNDVLMLWDGERSGLVGHDLSGVVSSTVSKLTPNESIRGNYLYYFLLHNFDWIQNRRTGTGIPHVPKDLNRMLVVKYPKDKLYQKNIAIVLETIDQTIEKTQALIEKYQKIKAGLMHDLFTRGITADRKIRPSRDQAPELYQQTPIGWIPKEWSSIPLGNIYNIVRGSTPRPAKDPRYFDGDFIPWITVGELSREDWPYLESTKSMLTKQGSMFSRTLKAGTLVISNSGYGCGVPKILHITGCANDGVAAFLDLNDDCNKLYIYYYLYSQTITLRTKVARGNDQPNLNTDMLGEFQIALPLQAEQELISDRLWGVERLIKNEKTHLGKLHLQKSGLMHDLLTGKITVNINDGDAND
jgi:type I restriction enzyme S subunit